MGKLMVSGSLVKCPECGGQNILKKGKTPARGGPKQRYVCFACGRSFYLPAKPATRKRAKAKSQNAPE